MRACAAALRTIGPIFLAMFLPVIGSAQTTASNDSRLPSGTKIRFELRDGAKREGQVVALRGDTLRATTPGSAESAIHVSEIRKLEVSNGRHRSVRRSLLIGTGAGVVLGTAIGALTHEPCEPETILGCILEPQTRAQSAGLGALGGGVAGLVIGGAFGMIPRERWERVRLDGGVVHLRTRMLRDGTQGVGLAVAF
jgi:hypothetical protein